MGQTEDLVNKDHPVNKEKLAHQEKQVQQEPKGDTVKKARKAKLVYQESKENPV